MKRLLAICIAIFIGFTGFSQSFPTTIAAIRALVSAQITTPTCAGCVTHTNEGALMDTTLALLGMLRDSISSGSGLQSTLNAGNSATNGSGNTGTFTLTDLSSNHLIAQPTAISVDNNNEQMTMRYSTIACHQLGFPNYYFLNFPIPSGIMNIYLPNETVGSGTLPNTLVKHTTKDSVVCVNGTNSGTLNSSDISLSDGTNYAFMGYDPILSTSSFTFFTRDGAGVSGSYNKAQAWADNGTIRTWMDTYSKSVGLTKTYANGNNIATLQDWSGDTLGAVALRNGGSYDAFVMPNHLTGNQYDTLANVSGTLMSNGFYGQSTQTLSSASSIVITHGLPFTPRAVIPVEVGGTPYGGNISVSGIGLSHFTVNFQTPVTGTITIAYLAIP